jgi:hypothetical protein
MTDEADGKGSPVRGMDERHIPAIVFACLTPGELRLLMCPEHGLAHFGIRFDVPASAIPPDLRTPNTRLWLEFDERGKLVKVDPIGDPGLEHLKGPTKLRNLDLSNVSGVTAEGIQKLKKSPPECHVKH